MAAGVEVGEGTCLLFFGAVTVAYLVQLVKAYVVQEKIMNPVDKDGRLQGLSATPASISKFLSLWTELGFILLYVWMCERWPAFDHGDKTISSFVFWLCTLVYILLAVCTWSFNNNKTDDSLLNREQTEEWKGWMQFMFLAYHYFHQNNIYNAVRCFISCYVWMTGFGNLSFFYTRQDYSVLRLIQMLWRLNFLVFWLCMLLGNTFILYYINPLHTLYFFVSFVTCAVASRLNRETCWALRMKISIVAILIFAIWEFPDNFNAVWGCVGVGWCIQPRHCHYLNRSVCSSPLRQAFILPLTKNKQYIHKLYTRYTQNTYNIYRELVSN